MSDENDRVLSAELGRALARADAAYSAWMEAREDFFQVEAEMLAAVEMGTEVRTFVSGSIEEGLDQADVQARLRRRFPVAADEPFFEAALELTEAPEGAAPGEDLPGITMTSDNKREALAWLVNSDRKYQLPFTKGRFGVVSLIGTRSWTDYAQVVLQSMIADSLLNIEEKLDRLLSQQEQGADGRTEAKVDEG